MITEDVLKKWEKEAKEERQTFAAAEALQLGNLERIISLISELRACRELIKKKDEALNWIMPKVHQAHHTGELESCKQSTCVEYRKATALKIEDVK